MIIPNGWLREFLQKQMTGLTGNIESCGYPFDLVWWGTDNANGAGENTEGIQSGWWTYEQTAYWLDGFLRCAILLNDKKAIKKGQEIIMSVIENASEDGYLGPCFLKETTGWNRWPHVVFFRACMALYDYTKDKKIINAIKRHYLGHHCDYSYFRDVFNVEIMLWIYEETNDNSLLNLAENSYIDYNANCLNDVCDKIAVSDKKPYAHGVTYCEYSKLGALLYKHTKKKEYLVSSKKAFDKAEQYFMLPGGCICSNEFLISNHYMQSYETCLLSDYTWALYALADATKEIHYYDLIERCIFNAGLGSVTEDFKALQYFSCANQVIADNTSNHNLFFCASKWMSYRPNPGTECCPGNVNRFMPNYILHTWERVGNSVYCHLYGESCYKDDEIEIVEKSNYPFEEKIVFHIKTSKNFVLKLRIPLWVKAYRIFYENQRINVLSKNGYIEIPVTSTCVLTLEFETVIETIKTYDGVYFRKGVLVYALGGEERREIDKTDERSNEAFPAYNMYPEFEWRYAMARKESVTYINGVGGYYTKKKDLPKLRVKGYHLPDWDYEYVKRVQRCVNLYDKINEEIEIATTFTPHFPAVKKETSEETILELYPYGTCKLRLTVFPVIN